MDKKLKFEKSGCNIDRGLSFCIYGDPGVGKTTLASTLPAGETLIINTEAGLGPLLGTNHIVFNLKNDLSDLDTLYEHLRTEKHPFKNIVIDNVSELEQWIILKLTKSRGKEFTEIREYGDAGFKMREVLHLFRDLIYQNMNVVFNAWEAPLEIIRKEGILESKLFPKVFKKVAPELCGIVDVVGRICADEKSGKRWIRIGPSVNAITKNQFKGLDDDERPDLPAMMRKIKEHNYSKEENNG